MGWSAKPWTAINAAENVILHPDRLDLPKRWQKPRMIFVNSMSDVFHEQVPDEFIDQMFDTMLACPQHTFQVLTKRPERMRTYIAGAVTRLHWQEWPAPHIWLGTTVEDQRRADERIPTLLAIRWPIRILSCEPLLGPVDLWSARYALPDGGAGSAFAWGKGVAWVIDGGESGAGFRAADPDWYRAVRDACVAANVPYFHKQGSAFKSGQDTLLDGQEWHQFPNAA